MFVKIVANEFVSSRASAQLLKGPFRMRAFALRFKSLRLGIVWISISFIFFGISDFLTLVAIQFYKIKKFSQVWQSRLYLEVS
jgi:hypothetical protein